MALVAGGGLTREHGEFWNMPLLDATTLDDAGYVLTYKVEDSINKVDKAATTDTPRCVNFRSTRDPFDLRETNHGDQTGLQIGLHGLPVFREGWAKLKVADDNAAIVRGDSIKVATTGGGKVDKYVGNAEEDIAAGTSGTPGKDKVLTHLSIGKVQRAS